jgi:Universal stress protein family
MFDKLLVANDGSQGGERAFQCALELAKRLGVALEMICVEELPRRPARIDEAEETRAEVSNLFETVAMNSYIEAKSQGVALKTHPGASGFFSADKRANLMAANDQPTTSGPADSSGSCTTIARPAQKGLAFRSSPSSR